jgi:hypothetical protein
MNGDYEHALLRLLAGEEELVVVDSEPARRRIRQELESSNPNTGLYRDFAAVDVRLNPSRIPAEEAGAPVETLDEVTEDVVDEVADEVEEETVDEIVDEVEEETVDEIVDEAATADEGGAADDGPPDEAAPVEAVAEPARPTPDEEDDVAGSEVEAGPSEHESVEAVDGRDGGSAREAAAVPGRRVPARPGDGTCAWCREELPERESLRFCPFCGTDVELIPCPECGEELQPSWRFCIACGVGVSPDE